MKILKTGCGGTIKIPACPQIPSEEVAKKAQSTFYPEELWSQIVESASLIPGYFVPSSEGIKEWAVKQIYQLGETHDLPNLRAYPWENWYRNGRWELWARWVTMGYTGNTAAENNDDGRSSVRPSIAYKLS